MSTPTLKNLQTAHFVPGKTQTYRNSMGTMYPMQSVPISHQPASSRAMDLNENTNEGEQQVDGPLRLRGGCIPLPVSTVLISLCVLEYD
jgi:hypothetical protein